MLETLIGRTLEGVARWAWHKPGEPADLNWGPAHLAFSGGTGVSLDTRSDFTLWWLEADDTAALDRTHQYVMDDGGQWRTRDASAEPTFAEVLHSRLQEVRPLFNAVGEVHGLAMTFESATVTLRSGQDGELVFEA